MSRHQPLHGVALAVGCSIAVAVLFGYKRGSDPYLESSRALAAKTRALIGDAHVAMGDRSGAFSYYYGNPVTQLEGLTNNADYLRALIDHRSLRDLLCARGVQYIVHFDEDLGIYDRHVARPFYPGSTSFVGPTLQVRKADEVAKIVDPMLLTLFPNNGYFYIWRLKGCASRES